MTRTAAPNPPPTATDANSAKPLSAHATLLSQWSPADPLPADLDAGAIDALGYEIGELIRPGLRSTNVDTLNALFSRYPAFDKIADAAAFWDEWLDDVAEWPGALLAEACRIWRNSPAKQRPHSAGQLRPSIQAPWNARKALATKLAEAKRILAARADTAALEGAFAHGPFAAFRTALVEAVGEDRAAGWLDVAEADGAELIVASGNAEAWFRRHAGDLVDACGLRLVFSPTRHEALRKARPPRKGERISDDDRAAMTARLRRIGRGCRTAPTTRTELERRDAAVCEALRTETLQ